MPSLPTLTLSQYCGGTSPLWIDILMKARFRNSRKIKQIWQHGLKQLVKKYLEQTINSSSAVVKPASWKCQCLACSKYKQRHRSTSNVIICQRSIVNMSTCHNVILDCMHLCRSLHGVGNDEFLGTIPGEIKTMPNLQEVSRVLVSFFSLGIFLCKFLFYSLLLHCFCAKLDLFSNQLTGTIPDWLGDLEDLVVSLVLSVAMLVTTSWRNTKL